MSSLSPTSVVERIKDLDLDPKQFVVICGGVLDALGLRRANDIDLVASSGLFRALRLSGQYDLHHRRDEAFLYDSAGVEIFTHWGTLDDEPNFFSLFEEGLSISGIRFANPRFVLDQKRLDNRAKDQVDVILLEGFLLKCES